MATMCHFFLHRGTIRCPYFCLITPPVGLNVYVVNSLARDIPSQEIFMGIIPFLLVDFLTLAVLIIFPQISLSLPSLIVVG